MGFSFCIMALITISSTHCTFGSVALGEISDPVHLFISNNSPDQIQITLTGAQNTHSKDFLINSPAFPWYIAPNSTSHFSISFSPRRRGHREHSLTFSASRNSKSFNLPRLQITGTGTRTSRFRVHQVAVGGGDKSYKRGTHFFISLSAPFAGHDIVSHSEKRNEFSWFTALPTGTKQNRMKEVVNSDELPAGELLLSGPDSSLEEKASVFCFSLHTIEADWLMKPHASITNSQTCKNISLACAHTFRRCEHSQSCRHDRLLRATEASPSSPAQGDVYFYNRKKIDRDGSISKSSSYFVTVHAGIS